MSVHPLMSALAPLADELGAELLAPGDVVEGDVPVVVDGALVGGFRLPGLHGALARLLESLARQHGMPLCELDREAKQQVVRRLDDLGAFTLRRAVEDVADALGVSRFTVYNYLAAT